MTSPKAADILSSPLRNSVCSASEQYPVPELSDNPHIILTTIIDAEQHRANKPLKWIAENCGNFRNSKVIICGAPGFVYAVTDLLLEHEFCQADLMADVYSYAPR